MPSGNEHVRAGKINLDVFKHLPQTATLDTRAHTNLDIKSTTEWCDVRACACVRQSVDRGASQKCKTKPTFAHTHIPTHSTNLHGLGSYSHGATEAESFRWKF